MKLNVLLPRCIFQQTVSELTCEQLMGTRSDTRVSEDVLKARLKTTGVVEHTFTMGKNSEFRGVDWKIYDVGGARPQRHAWAPYFDDGTFCLVDRNRDVLGQQLLTVGPQ